MTEHQGRGWQPWRLRALAATASAAWKSTRKFCSLALAEIRAKFNRVLRGGGEVAPLLCTTAGAAPTPTARGCDPLVEQVVMATDDFYYGTSVFTFWAQLGLANFQLKYLPVEPRRASARGNSAGALWHGQRGPACARGGLCSCARGSAGTR